MAQRRCRLPPLLAALAACIVAGCAPGSGAPGRMPPVSLAEATRQAVINYLFAHGMAESYVMSGRATEPTLLTLVSFDKAALSAITAAARDPGWTAVHSADHAVQALIAYTTSEDMSEAGSSGRGLRYRQKPG